MNISIRKWKIEDANDLKNVLNNKKIMDNLRDGIPYPYSIEDAKEYIVQTLNAKKDSQYCWAITDDEKVIGSIGVFRQNNIHYRTAEVGYYLAEEYRNQGVMTKILKDVCNCIFSKTDIIRIYAEPFSHNIGSCRALEKAGFKLEGILRKNAIKKNQIYDMKIYSILAKEN